MLFKSFTKSERLSEANQNTFSLEPIRTRFPQSQSEHTSLSQLLNDSVNSFADLEQERVDNT